MSLRNRRAAGAAGTRSRARIVVAAAALAILCLCFAPSVGAHAYLDGSTPENGEQLDAAPEAIELSYTGDGIQTADVSIVGPDGDEVSGDATIDPGDGRQIHTPLEDAGEGMYVVEWEVLADDGHTTSGTFFFSVGDDPVDRETLMASFDDDPDDDISWLEAVSKGAMLIAVIGSIGIPATFAFALAPLRRRRRSSGPERATDAGAETVHELYRRVGRSTAVLCSALSLVLAVSVVLFGIAGLRSLGGVSVTNATRFVGTFVGQVWALKLAVSTAGVGLVAAFALGAGSRRHLLVGTAVVGSLVAVAISVTSHSATAIAPFVGAVVDGVHIVAAAAWIGGLTVFAVFLSRVRELDAVGHRRSLTNAVVRRYSVFALAGAAFSVSTGIMLAAWHVGTTGGMTGTLYGAILAVKLPLIALAVVLGGYHRFVVVPRIDPSGTSIFDRFRGDGSRAVSDGGSGPSLGRFETTVRVELIALVCVLVLSGVLTSAATAAVVSDDSGLEQATIETTFEDGTDVHITAHSRTVETLGSEFMFDENELVVIDVEFERGGEPVASDGSVDVLATSPDGTVIERELEPSGEARYSTVQTLPGFGPWEIRISGEPNGEFGSAWIDAFVVPSHDIDESSPGGGESGDDHDHGSDEAFATPLFLFGLIVGLNGAVIVAREAILIQARNPGL